MTRLKLLYKRPNNSGINIGLRPHLPDIESKGNFHHIKIELLANGIRTMTKKRIYKNGNSFVMTLTATELNHMQVVPGQYIQLWPRRNKSILIKKAPAKLQPPQHS